MTTFTSPASLRCWSAFKLKLRRRSLNLKEYRFAFHWGVHCADSWHEGWLIYEARDCRFDDVSLCTLLSTPFLFTPLTLCAIPTSNLGANKLHIGVFEDAPATDFLNIVHHNFDWKEVFSGEYMKQETAIMPTEFPPCQVHNSARKPCVEIHCRFQEEIKL